jgi:hypothetical protein
MSLPITALFCCLDDFCRIYEEWERHGLLGNSRRRRREGKLALSEMLFIMVLFPASPFKDFKSFYRHGVCGLYRGCFRETPVYERFVALMPRLLVPMAVLLYSLRGEETGIYFADSTSLAVCHNRRINRNRVFKGMAARGKTSMGWFYGLKLHLIINHKGEIMAVKITSGNKSDSAALGGLAGLLQGKLYADKGYIGKALFRKLWRKGLQLITGIRRNMKNYLMPWLDKIMLRRRFIIETVFDNLKSSMGLEHTRHRSPVNAIVHILACLIAYCFKPNKPAVNMKVAYA